eukprot:Skav222960  [mRNA]  locus=scaffold1489:760773:760955:- [translate_table: standard]
MEQLQPSSVASFYLRLIEVCNAATGSMARPSVTAKSPLSRPQVRTCLEPPAARKPGDSHC